MPHKDYECRLAYYRQYWKDRPEQYKQHKINCSRNRRLRPLINWLKSNPEATIACLLGHGQREDSIISTNVLLLIPTFRKDGIPLQVFYNTDWVEVVT